MDDSYLSEPMPHSTPASPGPPRNPPSQHWPVQQPGQDQSDQQHTHGPHNLPNRGKTVSVHGPEEPLIVLGAPVNMSGTVAPVLAELQGRARRAFPATAGPNHALTCQKARGALPGVAGPHTPRSKSNPTQAGHRTMVNGGFGKHLGDLGARCARTAKPCKPTATMERPGVVGALQKTTQLPQTPGAIQLLQRPRETHRGDCRS